MSSQDLIKFLTKEFVQFVDTPKDERLKRKQEKKIQSKSWSHHWFGVLPIALKLALKRKQR
jgi:hypothetical protein